MAARRQALATPDTQSPRRWGQWDAKNLNDADKAETQRIARLYGTAAPKIDQNKAAFIGTFAHNLPRDVGGDGHYLQWQSPLGSVGIYVERSEATTIRRRRSKPGARRLMSW